jgi:hypothetical protein
MARLTKGKMTMSNLQDPETKPTGELTEEQTDEVAGGGGGQWSGKTNG